MLDSDKKILGGAYANEFVQFDLYCCAIAILRILNQEDHQKGDNCGAGIDNQLPGVRIVEHRPGGTPNDHNRQRDYKRIGPPGFPCDDAGYVRKATLDLIRLTFSVAVHSDLLLI